MEKTKCGSHAKKCHRHCHSPLSNPNDAGYNWEDVLVISEMTHAQEAKNWSERFVLLDKAYKSKLEKLRTKCENEMAAGYEEAYRVMQQMKDESETLTATLVNDLEARLANANRQIAACHKIIQTCCPEKLVTLLTEPHGENQ